MDEVNANTPNIRYLIPPQTPRLLWIAIALLALIVAGQGWYIHQVDLRSATAATTVSGQASLSDLKARLDALETNQHDWNRHAIALDARFDALATNQKDWNRHVMAVDSHDAATGRAEHAQLLQLEKEVATLRSETANATR